MVHLLHRLYGVDAPVCLARHVPVRPSVTVDQSKTVEVLIMKFSPHGSLIPLVFGEQEIAYALSIGTKFDDLR